MEPLSACGVILAGGDSRRMGVDKALLPFQGEPLIQRVAQRLQSWFSQVLVVTNVPDTYRFLNLPMAGDRRPGLGPLAGLEAGLTASRYPLVFFCACDMPFLDEGLVRYLVGRAPGYEITIPHVKGGYEPLHAVYARQCLDRVRTHLGQGRLSLLDLLAASRTQAVSEATVRTYGDPARLFFNCNTPEDLQKALGLAHSTKQGS